MRFACRGGSRGGEPQYYRTAHNQTKKMDDKKKKYGTASGLAWTYAGCSSTVYDWADNGCPYIQTGNGGGETASGQRFGLEKVKRSNGKHVKAGI